VNKLYFLARNKYFTVFVLGLLPAALTLTPAAMAFDSLIDDDKDPEEDAPKIDVAGIALDEDSVTLPLLAESQGTSHTNVMSVLNALGSDATEKTSEFSDYSILCWMLNFLRIDYGWQLEVAATEVIPRPPPCKLHGDQCLPTSIAPCLISIGGGLRPSLPGVVYLEEIV
jgi:hypothetical protein